MGNQMWTDQHHTVHQEHTNPDLIKSHKLQCLNTEEEEEGTHSNPERGFKDPVGNCKVTTTSCLLLTTNKVTKPTNTQS